MNPKFYRKILKNGITVILEKRSLPVVSVAFAVRCGGINESEEDKGISHFIEHMLYKGTASRSARAIAIEIEKNGGELNGFTEEQITAYRCKMPSKHLNIALNVLSDMVKNPLFDGKELEKERKVIFEEIKMRHDTPNIYVMDQIQNYLYDKPFAIPLIGTYETVSRIDRKKIVDRFNKIYTPNNMILCVVGDADFNQLVDFTEKNFGNEKGKVTQFPIKLRIKEKIETRKGVDQANLIFAYHVPLATNKQSYSAEVLNAVMALGMSSRLFAEIREKRNLAYAILGGSNATKDFAYNLIYAGTMKENVEKVKQIILEEFKKMIKELNEKELNQAKEQLIGNYHISMEDSQIQMINLLLEEIDGNAERFYEFEKRIKEVKLEDVKKLAEKIKPGNYSFFALVPE